MDASFETGISRTEIFLDIKNKFTAPFAEMDYFRRPNFG
jgi:hypothetical protein